MKKQIVSNLSALLASVLPTKSPIAAISGTPDAFGNSNKIKHNSAGSKLARRAAKKTIGVRVPTATCVVGGRVHIREVE